MTEALRAALASGDRRACVDVLARMTGPERRAAAPAVRKHCADLWAEMWKPESHRAENLREHEAAVMVAIAIGTPAELRKFIRGRIPMDTVDALAALRPDWLGEAAELLVAIDPLHFDVARALVRRGLSARPAHDNYILGLLRDTRSGEHPFDADPELLEHEVWRLFEVEGSGERSLAARDKYTQRPQSWAEAFSRQLRAGKLDRQRVIDATLGALERDFATFRAGWFSRFHDDLAPSTEELLAREDRYLRLLQSSAPATVTMAFAAVRAVDQARPLAAERLVPALASMCLSRHKSSAISALKTLRLLARREPDSRTLVAPVLAQALAHEAADVQKAALDVLDELKAAGTPGLADLVAPLTSGVSASLRNRARDSFGTAGAPEVPLVTEAAAPTSPTHPSFEIRPIATLAELVEAFSSVLEDDGDPNEVERVIDGLARLGAQRPADFAARVGPLAKRARQIRRALAEHPVLVTLTWLAQAWTAPPGQAGATLRDSGLIGLAEHEQAPALAPVLARRAVAVAAQLDAGVGTPLLSTPTHRGGWIAPAVFVERLLARGAGPEPIDLYLALLRLAPEGRALESLAGADATAEHVAAVRYAFGGEAEIGPTSALWSAACRARAPTLSDARVDQRHPGLGPDGAVAASFTWTWNGSAAHSTDKMVRTLEPKLPSRSHVPSDLIAVRRHLDAAERWARPGDKAYNRWLPTVWPSGSESYFGDVIQRLADNLDWWEARWNDIACYELLCAPFLRFGPMAELTLALGLAAKEPGQSRTSADAAIAAIASERLSGAQLGAVMRALRGAGFTKLKRWATTLRSVGGVSPFHARQVATAIQACLRGDPAAPPREEGALVAVLLELLAEHDARLTDGEAWAYLQAGRHRRKFLAFAP